VRRGRACVVGNDDRGVTLCVDDGPSVMLDPQRSPAAFRVPNLYEPSHPDVSEHVRHALERLHTEVRFERIEFPCRSGLGFRTIQAKQAGLAFMDVKMTVRLDSCGEWERENEQRWPCGYDEVERDFMERFSFENADERVVTNRMAWEFVQARGWAAKPIPTPMSTDDTPLVTIAIAYYNLGRFLPETLESLAGQTYPALDVVVIDDGSNDEQSRIVFDEMRKRYPQFRFLRQTNVGIGATRNRCLELARGEFFLPVDADNIAKPEMVERFVRAIQWNPHLDAMTCYFLAFEESPDRPIYAQRPTGGPHALSGIRNVYGDANAIFRTVTLRELGGYETDRGTSCEDWELFVKMVRAGKQIGVVPDHLFYYRQRPGGFSRSTNWFANHQRVMRQFARPGVLAPGDASTLWAALIGFHQRIEQLEAEKRCLRYRVVDRLRALARGISRLARRTVRSRTLAPGTIANSRPQPVGRVAPEPAAP
jgi:glycosyltransferase involved in cell wall biosynthesis